MKISCSYQIKEKFTNEILKWYKKNKTTYPWRNNPTPYRVLITEMLLRKTTRNQVALLFPSFFRRFPSLNLLAKARRKEIEEIITPLGMEKIRSRLLREVSKIIIKEYKGRIPKSREVLLALPGVGDYTADAVMLLARNERVPLVDTNSKRIVERVFTGNSNSERIGKPLHDFVEYLLPQKKYVEFNLALLDFANTVCLARNPKCKFCPVKGICNYYKSHVYK